MPYGCLYYFKNFHFLPPLISLTVDFDTPYFNAKNLVLVILSDLIFRASTSVSLARPPFSPRAERPL